MSIATMKQGIAALENLISRTAHLNPCQGTVEEAKEAITSLRQAIAEAEKQEPAGEIVLYTGDGFPCAPFMRVNWKFGIMPAEGTKLYTSPPQRQPLTDEHPLMVFAKECVLGAYQESELADAAQRAIEAAIGIKGEA